MVKAATKPVACPDTLEEFQSQLALAHVKLSRRLKEVSQYVTEQPQSIAVDTAAVIAEKSGVHASTLVRFANHFGFNGFTELQKLYKQAVHNQYVDYGSRIRWHNTSTKTSPTVTPTSLLDEFTDANMAAMAQLKSTVLPESLDAAVELLHNAGSVHVCGIKRAFPVAMYFTYALNQIDVKCHAIDSVGFMVEEQCNCIADNDVLIAITFAPYSEVTQQVIERANSTGASIILITGDKDSPGAALSNVVFPINDAEVRSFRSLTSSMCLAQSLCIALGFKKQHSDAANEQSIHPT